MMRVMKDKSKNQKTYLAIKIMKTKALRLNNQNFLHQLLHNNLNHRQKKVKQMDYVQFLMLIMLNLLKF